MMTGERRYRQAMTKANILSTSNLRKFLADEIPWLPQSKDREFIIAEFDRLHAEIGRLREALHYMAKDPPANRDEPDMDWEVIEKMRTVAREALDR